MKPVSLDNNSLPIEYKNVPGNSYFPIKIALGIITTTGGIITLFSIISYLPHSVGYYAGPITFCSFVSFCVVCCADSSKGRNSPPEELDTTVINQVASKKNPKKINNKSNPANQASLPDEVLLKVFDYLDPKDLTRVGGVCQCWRDISSDNTIWQKHYNRLGICPPENSLALPESFKQEVVDALLLEKSIRTQEPKKTIYRIPNVFSYFYYLNDRIYIGSCEELSIISLNGTVSKSCKLRLSRCGYFKPFESKIFCLTYSEESFFLTSIDLNDKLILGHFRTRSPQTIRFETLHYNEFPTKFEKPFAFEVTENAAFVGDKNGDIIIWDLTKRYLNHSDEIPYFVENIGKRIEEAPNDTEVERLKNISGYCWVELYFFIKNRPILKGHTSSIIGMQVIDQYLFSISYDGTVIQWDLSTRQQVNSFQTLWSDQDLPNGSFLFRITGNALFVALKNGI